MPQPSDYDRYHRVLGLEPGASLVEIEESWRLRLTESHPDKFTGSATQRATSRAQEINNSRDELRRYWRAYGAPPPTLTASRTHDAAPAWPEPHGPASAAAPSPEAAAGAGPSRRRPPEDAPGRRGFAAYAAACALSLLVLLGSLALLPVGTESGAGWTDIAGSTSLGGARAGSAEVPPPALRAAPEGSTAPAETRQPEPRQDMMRAAAAPAMAAPAAPALTAGPEIAWSDFTSATAADGKRRDADPMSTGGEPAGEPAAPGALLAASPSGPEPRAAAGRPSISAPARSAPAPGAAGAAATGRARVASSQAPAAARPAPSPAARSSLGGASPQAHGAAGEPVRAAASACQSDLRTHCAHVQRGDGRIGQCLREHFRQLSPACSSALAAARAARQSGGTPAPAR